VKEKNGFSFFVLSRLGLLPPKKMRAPARLSLTNLAALKE
jgi:hypothetical protein